MINIQLSKGYSAKISDEDFNLISKYKWCASKLGNKIYVITGKGKNRIKMHRLIMGINDSSVLVDHKDGDGLNNQRDNLRVCNDSQNNANRTPWQTKHSKYLGVYKRGEKWIAGSRKDGKLVRVYNIETEVQAAIEYNKLAIIHHGEFAKLNIIDV